jgi:hypothetical protein
VALPGELSELEVTTVAEPPTLTSPADELYNLNPAHFVPQIIQKS